MSLSQNDSGRALEYGIAITFQDLLPAELQDSSTLRKAKACFDLADYDEQESILLAAREVVTFLDANDLRLDDTNCIVLIQSDRQGQLGDVRDVIVKNRKSGEEIGLSVKNRHNAVKHSRLSERIDFGTKWINIKCSDVYFNTVNPLFRELRSRKILKENWRDIPNKVEKYYLPLLKAFQIEMEQLFANNPKNTANALVQYLLGKYDFYKVIKQNKDVSITSFNINGSLKWGRKIPLPTKIINIDSKPDSLNTIIMTFDNGWQLSFRIHNASTRVEPSLKFDINIVGNPSKIATNNINYRS